MTMGELFDRLKEIEKAERDVADAMHSFAHGGNADTMKRKTDSLQYCADHLQRLRDEPIEEKDQ